MDVILLPNWIENVLTVKGETEDLLMFLDKHLIGSWFKFDTVIPQPVTREECPKEYLVSDEIESRRLKEDPPMSYPGDKTWFDWYNWNRDKWGCKWESEGFNPISKDMIKSEKITEIALKFTTAWTAPIPVVKALSVLYPRLGFILEYYSFESMVTGTAYLNGDDEFVFEEYNLQEQ